MLNFLEAIEFAESRHAVLPVEFYGKLQTKARESAFTISGAASLAQVEAVMDSLKRALTKGQTLLEWKRSIEGLGLDLPEHRLDTIFRTNMQVAYNHGHWVQQQRMKSTRPYLMYDAVNDSRTRPSHAALDNVIRHIDDPFWETHYPPNGFNCRCSTITMTAAQAKARGGETPAPKGGWPEPDDGWEFNPAISYDKNEMSLTPSKHPKLEQSRRAQIQELGERHAKMGRFYDQAFGGAKTSDVLKAMEEAKEQGLKLARKKDQLAARLRVSARSMARLDLSQQSYLKAAMERPRVSASSPLSLHLRGDAGKMGEVLAKEIQGLGALQEAPRVSLPLPQEARAWKEGSKVSLDGLTLAQEGTLEGPKLQIGPGVPGIPVGLLSEAPGALEWVLFNRSLLRVSYVSRDLVILEPIK